MFLEQGSGEVEVYVSVAGLVARSGKSAAGEGSDVRVHEAEILRKARV